MSNAVQEMNIDTVDALARLEKLGPCWRVVTDEDVEREAAAKQREGAK